MTSFRLLVTGSRSWREYWAVESILDKILRLMAQNGPDSLIIVNGGAEGADRYGARWAHRKGFAIETHRPDWHPDGPLITDRGAGCRRNQVMVDAGADLCVAFVKPCAEQGCTRPQPHFSHGAMDCVTRARRAGIPVAIYTLVNGYLVMQADE